MPAIQLEDVVKKYNLGETIVEALRGADIEIQEGEFVAVMGPSGSGKSTLMNMIGALDTPTEGSVKVAGNEIRDLSENQLAYLILGALGFSFLTGTLSGLLPARKAAKLQPAEALRYE